MAINGLHGLVYTSEPDKLRAMLRDVFKFKSVDAGGGWLIFQMPPAELGIHPAEGNAGQHSLSFMCDDINKTVAELRAKGVIVTGEPQDHGYGIVTHLELPGGVKVQLYEPRHPIAAAIPKKQAAKPKAAARPRQKASAGSKTKARPARRAKPARRRR
jgi:predicted enzyme related to lactoylglutathione lyase